MSIKFGRDICQVMLSAMILLIGVSSRTGTMKYAEYKNENITLDHSFTLEDSFQQDYSLPRCIFVQFSDFTRDFACDEKHIPFDVLQIHRNVPQRTPWHFRLSSFH